MASCHPSCTTSKVICATGLYFVAGTWREHGGNINHLSFLMMLIVFGLKRLNFLTRRASQNQKRRDKITLGVKYKNLLAPQATPKGNSNIGIINNQK